MTEQATMQSIRNALDSKAQANLENLWTMKKASADRYKEAIKAVGEKAHIDPAIVNGFITATMNDKLEAFTAKADQLDMFVEVIEEKRSAAAGGMYQDDEIAA